MSGVFTDDEYAKIREGCQSSARAVVPYVCALVKPKTVIDVGGGEGWWADEFAAAGAEYVLVVDPATPQPVQSRGVVHFGLFDVTDEGMTTFPAQFDLAVCLETAEHLDPVRGENLVAFLCKAARVVLWSAAIPGQGGHGHVNEQWPDYWAEKFETNGLVAHDVLRGQLWNDERVEPWYRQNLLLFTGYEYEPEFSDIPSEDGLPLPLVHPDIFGWRVAERDRLHAVLYPPPDGDGTVWNG